MLTVPKNKLKAKMLEYFRHVENDGEELIVTSHGKPVLKVLPYSFAASPEEVFADLRGKIKYHGDITEPETQEWGDA